MKMMRGFTVTPLLPVAVCLMAGIVVGTWWQPGFSLLPVLVAAVVAAYGCQRWPLAQTLTILASCSVLGMTLVQTQKDNDVVDISQRVVQGVVMSEAAERTKTMGIDLLVPSAGGRTLRCYLWKDERSRNLKLGDELVARVQPIHPSRGVAPRTPIFFIHSSEWLRGGNAVGQLSSWQRTRLWFLRLRHRLLERYHDSGAEADTYAVLAAMTLGDKSAQSRELRDLYSVSGASHILAVSGLHVGIVYMLLTMLMLGRRQFWLSQVLTVAAIWAFALVTGLSPSVVRAATMVSLYALFAVRGGRQSPLNVLCFAAIVMLVADVQTLFDVGFQLSFAAVFAILLFLPMLQAMYQPHNVLMRWAWNMALLSLCAVLGTSPLIAYYFHRFSTYFLLTNFLVVPAATFILYGALLSLLFPPVSIVLIKAVEAMNGGLHIIASMPGSCIEGLHPTPLQVSLVYLLILLCYFILRKLTSILQSP